MQLDLNSLEVQSFTMEPSIGIEPGLTCWPTSCGSC